jgi:copper(I)-binding protein
MDNVTRRRMLQAGLAVGLSLRLRPARACEFWTGNLRVTHPWTRATPDDATSAVVCMKFDEVAEDDRLIGIETAVASGAMLGGAASGGKIDLPIPRGRETLLSEHGTCLRLIGLREPLYLGRSYPIELRFARSGSVAADLSVDYEALA